MVSPLVLYGSYGYQTVVNSEGGAVSGTYRSFLEFMSFILFLCGFVLNSGILFVVIPARRTFDNFDGFLVNLIFGELVSTFSLAFLLFYQFAGSLTAMGNGGCSFVAWLNVTSVSITVAALIGVTFALYNKLFHGDKYRMQSWKFVFCIFLSWLIAGLPGLPYLATARMGKDGYCTITDWSGGAEIIFICCMIVFQIVLPLALLVYLLVRIFLALRSSPEDGEAVISEENTPGTEANFQRAVVKRQVMFIVLLILTFYMLLVITSFVSLGVELNINNIKGDKVKFARIRELVALFQCFKCAIIPLIYLMCYDKLKKLLRNKMCKRNQEMYNNLQYSVYQDTVHEAPTTEPSVIDNNRLSRELNDDYYETDRDDVAILRIGQ